LSYLDYTKLHFISYKYVLYIEFYKVVDET